MSGFVPEHDPQRTVGDASGSLRFSLSTLAWAVSLAVFFLGSIVAAQADQPAVWFVYVFGVSLLAQAVFLNVESQGSVLRWFGVGVLSALVASACAAAVRGHSAFSHLTGTKFSDSQLRAVLDSPLGCVFFAVGLSLVCGIIVAAIQLFIMKRYGLSLTCLILILTWLLFWNVGVEACSVSWFR